MISSNAHLCFLLGKPSPITPYTTLKHITDDLPSHGLSYTTFELSTLEILSKPQSPTIATVKVRNTGAVAGSEVLQLYILAPDSPTQRPLKELHGFEKVFLRAGEEKLVKIPIDEYATSYWDESEGKWCSERGIYVVRVATSSREDAVMVEAELEIKQTRWWIGL